MSEPIRVVVRRGDVVEAVHSVHAVGSAGAVAGDSGLVSFLRSSSKPLQALPLVRARPDLEDADVAIASASHRAEPAQIEAVRRLLAKAGATEAELECGTQEGRPAGPLWNNCSGKHAGMLATCRARNWETRGYRLAAHPLQLEIARLHAEASGLPEAEIPMAIDGCGVVTFALSLARTARVFGALDGLEGGQRVLAAMRARPELVGGEGSLDTQLMRARPGWAAKGGAEGLLCVRTADGEGVVLKSEDGSQRPLGPALGRFLGIPEFERVPVLNTRGGEVGEVVVA